MIPGLGQLVHTHGFHCFPFLENQKNAVELFVRQRDTARFGARQSLDAGEKILFPGAQRRIAAPLPDQERECEVGFHLFSGLAT